MSGIRFKVLASALHCLPAARLRLLVCLGLFTLGPPAQAAESAAPPSAYAFVNVTVIPMRTPGVLEKQTVIVKEGRIAKIGPVGAVEIDPGVTVIVGEHRYLLPGLTDMHVHIWDERELPLYVANGVTLVRNMWGQASTLAMRERVMAGELIGPTIVTAGPLIDGEPRIWGSSARAVTPAEGEALVAEHKAAGYDFIKVYSNLRPEVFDAIAAAAKRQRIPFAGHVPESVPLEHALRSGMVSIEHLTGFMRATLADGLAMGVNGRSPEMLALGRRLQAGEISPAAVFDENKLQAMAQRARRFKVWNTPTLLVLKNTTLTGAEAKAALARDELQYIPASMQMNWGRASRSDADQSALQSLGGDANGKRVAALHRAGAGILVGTDAPNPHVIHGFAIHEELALLEQAGLTPFEVLKAATANAAEFLGTPAQFGSVTEGARADLLLVEADPLADLANLQHRAGVMLRGRWLPETQLQAMLKQVAAYHRTAPDWFAKVTPLPLASGADVRLRAQFISTYAGKPVAADRLAVVAAGTGGRNVIAQSMAAGRNSGERLYRLELDETGALVRYTFEAREQFGSRGSLVRDGAAYRLAVDDRDSQTITPGAGDIVLTATIADGFILADRLQSLPAGRSKQLTVWTIAAQRGGLRLVRQTWTVERRPDVAQTEHAQAIGFDIQVRGETGAQAMTLWLERKDGSPLRLARADGLFQQRRVE